MTNFSFLSRRRLSISASRSEIGSLAGVLMLCSAVLIGTHGLAAESASDALADATRFVVYFSHDGLAGNPYDCTAVFPVERSVPKTMAIATAALQELFRGPTQTELEAGYHSFFSSETAGLLRRLRVSGGHAYLDLHDMRAALSGATSSCGAAELHSQIERTLFQFPSIKGVIYAIEGDPRLFHEWVNEPCDENNKGCDPRPFQIQP